MVIFHNYVKLPEGTPKSSKLGFEKKPKVKQVPMFEEPPIGEPTRKGNLL